MVQLVQTESITVSRLLLIIMVFIYCIIVYKVLLCPITGTLRTVFVLVCSEGCCRAPIYCYERSEVCFVESDSFGRTLPKHFSEKLASGHLRGHVLPCVSTVAEPNV